MNEDSLCPHATLPFSGLCVVGCARHNQLIPHRAVVGVLVRRGGCRKGDCRDCYN